MSSARILPLLIGLLALPGCSGWRPMRLAPESAPVIDPSSPVRATPVDGRAVVMWNARVVGDSLIGEVGTPPLRTAVALRDLGRLEKLGFSRARTIVAVSTGIILGFTFWVLDGVLGATPG